MRIFRIALSTLLAAVVAHAAVVANQGASSSPRVEISFAAGARSAPVTGRVYVAISRTNDRAPIQQADSTGAPFFGKNVEGLAPGAAAVIGADDFGHPVASLRDIPAGDYWVQPFVNVYTEFKRADGHTVWLHMDQWEGQDWKKSPGNLYGDPVKVKIDPSSTAPIRCASSTSTRTYASSGSRDVVASRSPWR